MPHGKIYSDVTGTVGNTPLIRLNRISEGLPVTIVIKHEGYNPFDSVKDRIGAAMIPENAGKLIVSVVCDFGERYLSNPVYAELLDPDFSDVEEALQAPAALA